jgi:hypothetical protein
MRIVNYMNFKYSVKFVTYMDSYISKSKNILAFLIHNYLIRTLIILKRNNLFKNFLNNKVIYFYYILN